jgi:hypothetical protein
MATRWFYVADSRCRGPLELDTLVEMLLDAKLPRETLVWRKELPEWTAASAVPEIAVELPPPLPVVHAPQPAEPGPVAADGDGGATGAPADDSLAEGDAGDASDESDEDVAPREGETEEEAATRVALRKKRHRHGKKKGDAEAWTWWVLPTILGALLLVGLALVLWHLFQTGEQAGLQPPPG